MVLPAIPKESAIEKKLVVCLGQIVDLKVCSPKDNLPWICTHIIKIEKGFRFIDKDGNHPESNSLKTLLTGLDKDLRDEYLHLFGRHWTIADLAEEYPDYTVEIKKEL